MNQYTNFFTSYRAEIDANCNRMLNNCRDKAFETFRALGFPKYKTENYQHVNIEKLLDTDFGFYLQPSDAGFNPRHVFHCDVPNLDSYKCFAVNGHFFKDNTETQLAGNVFSGDMNEFATLYPDVFSKYYNRLAAEKGDGLTAFNTAFAQGGYMLYVPENTILEKAVQLTNIAGGNAVSLVNRRMLVVLERGAQAKLLVCDHAYDEKPVSAATQVTEIFAREGAKFDFCELEESSRNTIRLAENFVHQAACSELRINNITLSNGTTRNNTSVDLTGEHATVNLCGMAIADERQTVDNHTLINHSVPSCRSDELFKYVLDDEATGVFSGRIIVEKGAQRTEAFQSNRNLLGSRRCRMYSKPQLEIYADDVKCSHGMTTGQLDENALFYMRSRGIPHDEVVLMLKAVFMSDVIRGVRMEGLRDRLKMLVEKRFRGELATCRGCCR
ncbi:MAG: Fe-S cluster assembly protein SufD [Dysgonamonadaceae bacterium]|jgi:Fe-S cluster assembly protein SufD|nr:Fe-S cluster assembly protein SufD [Dysgonamonadaceae bacterium]